MKKIICMTAFIFLLACSGRYYTVTNAFRKGIPADMQTIIVDTSYHFFIRQVYKDSNQKQESILTTNPSGSMERKKLIEIEYLLISPLYHNVIYITTVPDKRQRYYDEMRLPDSLINSYDFNTFHFGKLDGTGNLVRLISKDSAADDTWRLSYPQGTVHIEEVVERKHGVVDDVILVDESLGAGVQFREMPNYKIVFRRFSKKLEKRGRPPAIRHLTDNKIYFRKLNGKYYVYFRFDKNVVDSKNNKNTTDSTIYFDDKRIRYTPVPLSVSNN